MEKLAHTPAPQPIGNEIEQALKRLQSLPRPSEEELNERLAEYEHSRLMDRYNAGMADGGYPKRALKAIPDMHGPGLIAAKEIPARLERGGIVFLVGDRGPGKTQMATWVAHERGMSGKPVGTYRKALDAWAEIRATWKHDSEQTEADVLRRYFRTSLLVVDEAQERGDTEADRIWCDRMLTHIVDHRYDAMLPTLIIANLTIEQYEKTIPASVRSRVGECGGVKVCDWPSYRSQ